MFKFGAGLCAGAVLMLALSAASQTIPTEPWQVLVQAGARSPSGKAVPISADEEGHVICALK